MFKKMMSIAVLIAFLYVLPIISMEEGDDDCSVVSDNSLQEINGPDYAIAGLPGEVWLLIFELVNGDIDTFDPYNIDALKGCMSKFKSSLGARLTCKQFYSLNNHILKKAMPSFKENIFAIAQDHNFQACSDKAAVIRLALFFGVDPNSRGEHSRPACGLIGPNSTPLHVFVCKFDRDVIDLLLNCGASPDNYDDQNETPLHHIMCSDYYDAEYYDTILPKLLPRSHDKVSCLNESTLLHRALCGFGSLSRSPEFFKKLKKVVLFLLPHVDVNLSDNHKETALHKALKLFIHYKNKELVKVIDILLQHDADVNEQDEFGCTALHKILRSLDYLNSCIGSSRYTDDSKTIEYANAIIKSLLNKGAKIDLEDKEGKTALMVANTVQTLLTEKNKNLFKKRASRSCTIS